MVKDQFQTETFSPLAWMLLSVIAPLTLFTGFLVLGPNASSLRPKDGLV